MSEGRVERCETCRFWKNPRENDHGDGLLTGSCNRFPPSYVGIPRHEDDEPHDDPSLWAQPPMCQDEWCGEWQKQKPDLLQFLSKKERKVWDLHQQGMTLPEIAKEMKQFPEPGCKGYTREMVRISIGRIKRKLGLN